MSSFTLPNINQGRVRAPPGGFQTYAFSDADLSRSVSFNSFSEQVYSTQRRPAKKMNVNSPNRTSMHVVLHGNPPENRRPSSRVAPGGKTTIEECFRLDH
eukprot:gene273-287_t